MKKFFITGAAGFIGSHVCEHIVKKFPKDLIVAIDKLTYAGNKFFLKQLLKINFTANRRFLNAFCLAIFGREAANF